MRVMNRLMISVVVVVAAAACAGRDPDIGVYVEPTDGGTLPNPDNAPRQLVTKKLFGTMPVENRVEDPLMTMTGSSWSAYPNNFRAYPTVYRRAAPSPTGTPYFDVPGAEDDSNRAAAGAIVIGQVKVSRGPLHAEIWIGRPGVDVDIGAVGASLTGLFVDGSESSVDLTLDESAKVVVDNKTWVRLSADLDEGPVGWAAIIAGDASDTPRQAFVGGAVVVDLPPNPNAVVVPGKKRAWSERERAWMNALREKNQRFTPPPAPRPSPVPGVPRATSSAP
jgi:hypothetical protein